MSGSVSIHIAGRLLERDPRTGEYVESGNWDPIPKHVVTVKHVDGSESIVRELRDQDFILAIVSGDWEPFLTKQRGSEP
ncbi:hypothetical protein JQ620_15340 [Bradyrhizobium sp. AUGA SZCCT0274]|uniref:hypothetical protein n=1 Tax=Bradyrhizobium sp. AUGA SZCCT0274 TaxID=2807670 RepID=UPI001BAA9C54|nr:hypothetical protein [Bradyrhizobium sp. AUGA SZCCT0274]MBR1241503.1 hypothetical protein [Bradyrhizobium sp. AUGA SZCCT0274]